MKKLDPVFRSALDSAYTHAISHLEHLDETSVAATSDVETLRARVARPLPSEGIPADEAVAELVRNVEGGLLGSAGGRFFGWVIGGVLPAALAADWLTSAWQQNGALYATSPAGAIVEETVGAWLKDIFGLPDHASFALVTGCQMAHVTGLAAARHALLAKRDWDVEARGLYGAPPIRLLSSDVRHASFERAVRLLGLGHANVVDLPVDAEGKLVPRALAEELAKAPDAPAIVLLQAGDINIGAYDDFESIVPIAKQYGAWVHVDGAIGLWVTASQRRKHLLKGIERCDSWATDGHKWLNVPFDCGFAFVANPDAHRASLSVRASYLTHASAARDQMDWNPEWSRRSRSFAVYAALRQLGRQGVTELVDRCCDHARSIVNGIGELAGAEVLWEPTINQGLVRFPDPRPSATDVDHDRHTDAVIAAILKTGEAFFGGTTWRGRRAMRVSVCNWQTSEADVSRVIAAVDEAIKSVSSVG
ncbi:MAG TPA: aminotransferase class V-fold PLP-dependent enzyme [Pyrinomonadaceae bacterium]|nr:aminotransferase class V-fold PLP-dependent enzyme [Pyrinomonadaceae bacterium]